MEYQSPDHLLEDVQLVLENEAKWYKWCTMDGRHLPAKSVDKMNIVRADETHFANALKYYYCEAVGLSQDQRIYLRRYFLWRYTTHQTTPPPEYTAGGLKQRPAPLASLTITPEKPTVSNKLTFKPIYLLNGVDLNGMNRNDIYTAIAAEEQRLNELRKIQHQPKSLVAEIEAGEAALKALVEHLDAN